MCRPMHNILLFFVLFTIKIESINTLRLRNGKLSPLWSGPCLTRECKRNFKLIVLIGLVALETSTEIFVRLPQNVIYGSTPQVITKIDSKARDLVLIFPGAGGPDSYTEQLKTSIERSDQKHRISRPVYVYDWLHWRGSFLRAAFDSQSVGKAICSNLASKQHFQNLHVIGISVGAFAADSCAKAYTTTISHDQELSHGLPTSIATSSKLRKEDELELPSNTKIRLTFLDPFTSKGVFGYGWGNKFFGRIKPTPGMDAAIAGVSSSGSLMSNIYVEDYINTDDPVPTTSEPLLEAYNFDVTNSKLRNKFMPSGDSMHSWPVVYLAKVWNTEVDENGEISLPTHIESINKGDIIPLP